MFVGTFSPRKASVVCDAILERVEQITCPKEWTVLVTNRHFLYLSATTALWRSVSTIRTGPLCFCDDSKWVTVSSKDTRAIAIILWKA